MPLQEEIEAQGLWLFKYRSYLPLVVVLIGFALYVRTEIYPGTFILEGTPYEVYYEMAALCISLFGLAIRICTVGYTPNNTSGRNTTEGQIADTLNTKGIYSLLRHPLYLANLFMWLGPALWTGNFWFIIAFLFFFWIYYERIMFAEEQYLRKKFGQEYIEWSNKTPLFIPRFRNYKKNDLTFSWKKVFRQEKSGLLSMFLIFTLFNVLGEFIKNKRQFNYFLIFSCAFSLILYIVLKYLEKNTTLLNDTRQ